MWLYVSPILLIFGCLGNVLALVVLTSSKMRQSRCSLSLSVLSVVDIMVLCTGLLRQWIMELTDVDIRTLSEAGCKIHLFLTYYCSQLSSWTLLLVSLERAVSVCSPLKSRTLCRRRNLIIWGCVIAISLGCVNAPVLWIATLVDYSDVEIGPRNSSLEYVDCALKEEYTNYNNDVLYWLDFVLLCLIPFIVIFTCSTVIIVKVSCGRPKMFSIGGAVPPTTGPRQKQLKKTKKLSSTTVMLVLVCVVFLLTTVPLAVYFLGIDIWFSEKTAEAYAKTFLLYTVTNLIYYISNAINFTLYCLAGSKFRQAALAVFCGRCMRGRYRRSWRRSLMSSILNNNRDRNQNMSGSSTEVQNGTSDHQRAAQSFTVSSDPDYAYGDAGMQGGRDVKNGEVNLAFESDSNSSFMAIDQTEDNNNESKIDDQVISGTRDNESGETTIITTTDVERDRSCSSSSSHRSSCSSSSSRNSNNISENSGSGSKSHLNIDAGCPGLASASDKSITDSTEL